jgi:hypothetical protein
VSHGTNIFSTGWNLGEVNSSEKSMIIDLTDISYLSDIYLSNMETFTTGCPSTTCIIMPKDLIVQTSIDGTTY